ncbi:hypothetical protein QYF61_017390 [Mycteria americana]|uniref:Uncharacterized protein n=1 Tax=Mycteria americana TaxID=33587 RepID=A0AAN7NYJ1_MYCAM|nr:hypothetical protein QYF61_017390 [Mycteria americana]
MLNNPFSDEILPNIQCKPPLTQLEAISSCPIACYLGEETDTHLATASFQAVVESNKTCSLDPSPALLLFFGHNPAPQCREGPKTEHSIKGAASPGDNHFPSAVGHTIPDTSHDVICLLGHLGILLAHIQLTVDQHPQCEELRERKCLAQVDEGGLQWKKQSRTERKLRWY